MTKKEINKIMQDKLTKTVNFFMEYMQNRGVFARDKEIEDLSRTIELSTFKFAEPFFVQGGSQTNIMFRVEKMFETDSIFLKLIEHDFRRGHNLNLDRQYTEIGKILEMYVPTSISLYGWRWQSRREIEDQYRLLDWSNNWAKTVGRHHPYCNEGKFYIFYP